MAETGHARNIEHFATMINFVEAYGACFVLSRAIKLTFCRRYASRILT